MRLERVRPVTLNRDAIAYPGGISFAATICEWLASPLPVRGRLEITEIPNRSV